MIDSFTPAQVTLLRLSKQNLVVWATDEVGPGNRADVELLHWLKLIELWEVGFRVTQLGTEALKRVDEFQRSTQPA